jgi:hypothetical protein
MEDELLYQSIILQALTKGMKKTDAYDMMLTNKITFWRWVNRKSEMPKANLALALMYLKKKYPVYEKFIDPSSEAPAPEEIQAGEHLDLQILQVAEDLYHKRIGVKVPTRHKKIPPTPEKKKSGPFV